MTQKIPVNIYRDLMKKIVAISVLLCDLFTFPLHLQSVEEVP